MPYKFNEAHRHKIPKAKYKVTNWPDYDAALVRRGSLTVWVTEEAIAAWHAPATGKRGGQPAYSDLAIETGLALRLVLHLGLRQVEGTLGSIVHLLGIDIKIPDHTTFSRRGVADIVRGQFHRDDLVTVGINREMKLAPVSAASFAVLFFEPFTLTVHFKTGAIDEQM